MLTIAIFQGCANIVNILYQRDKVNSIVKIASIPIVSLTSTSTIISTSTSINLSFQYVIKFFVVFFLLFILLLFIKNFFKIDLIKFRFILGLVIYIYQL
ncbi:hypothetical protein C1646_441880 [Rhizophagus diaphanus]|nr:hypothetical protein C1646_441880 [Rhizophagus diaphanus] [Rhizophagus sp. MUCL 43196]